MRQARQIWLQAAVSTLALILAVGAATAEIPSWGRRQGQDQAPEAVMIRVVKVTASCSQGTCSFDVSAKVRCILRSRTNLKPGQTIMISYVSVFDRPGSPVPQLAEGGVYPAFLKHSGSGEWDYVPAAASASFQGLIDPLSGREASETVILCRSVT